MMLKSTTILVAVLFFSCKTTTYYIVRHAEKESGTAMTPTTIKTTDVPLSQKGLLRAETLKDKLKNKRIKYVFSTNTMRTMATARPLAQALGQEIQVYTNVDTTFINQTRKLSGNVFIVGHSNTVDDLVNLLVKKKQISDLPDSAYGDLFVVKCRSTTCRLKAIDRVGE